MFPIRTSNRKAISAVLTTIIILVASIVLGTGVVVYSTSLFQAGSSQSAVQVQGVKTWVNATSPSGSGYAWGAVAIKNTGDKLLALSSITIRSTSIPFSSWYAETNQTRASANFQAQFNYTKNDANGNIKGSANSGGGVYRPSGAACIDNAVGTNPPTILVIQEFPVSTLTPAVCLAQQSGPVSLTPGASVVIYYKLPNNLLTPSDAGVAGTVSYLAGSAPVSQTVRIANPS